MLENQGAAERIKLLERRAAINEALNKSLDIFVSHNEKTFEEVMSNGLFPIAETAGLNRIIIYRIFHLDGEMRVGQHYRWEKEKGGVTPLDESMTLLPRIPVIERWLRLAEKDECFDLQISTMAEDEAAFLGRFGIRSIIFVPVISYGKLWGLVTFQDHENERAFDECADLLCSAGHLCANAAIRAQMKYTADDAFEKLRRREHLTNTLNKAAVVFLSQSEETYENMMTDGVGMIAGAIQLDRISVWQNLLMPDGLHSSQIYRWEKASGGTTEPKPGLEDVTYKRFAPRWENLLAGNETINGPVSRLPENEAVMLQSFGVVSAFVSPIFLNNVFWGFVLFADCQNQRTFDDECAEMMRSAAFLFANTVIRIDMESKIFNANNFNRAILNGTPVSLVLWDEDHRIIDCNDAALELLKCEMPYLTNRFWELSPEFQPDGTVSKERMITNLKRVFNGEKLVFDWIHRSRTGEDIPCEVTLTRIRRDEKYVGLASVYDMRHTNELMESIREHSDQLAARLEQQEMMAGISNGLVSSGNAETLVNEALAKLGIYYGVSFMLVFRLDYGRRDTALAYKWIAEGASLSHIDADLFDLGTGYFPDEMPEGDKTPMVICKNTEISPVEAFRKRLETGVHAFIYVPIYAEGRLWGFMSVEQCHKAREWTESEEEFIAMTASTIAGAIMRDVYDQERSEALKQATAASRAKSDFLSNMSHEMRTPLNAVIGMATIGKNAQGIGRKNYALEKIDEASVNLLSVINDVLDMSKIEANKLELSPIEYNFEQMLQKVASVTNFRMGEKRQYFGVNIDVDVPPFIVSDDQRLSQVIINLLSNASKFTPEKGKIDLNVTVLGEESGICTLRIEVADNGIGISPEQQENLFNMFAQAESGTTRMFGGTGLGLALCKRIVEMMGGEIWVESEKDKGSTFIFTIKVARGKRKLSSLLSPVVKRETLRVLAVDDDEVMLSFYKSVFSHIGVKCDVAADGAAALHMTEKGYYDVCFVDWHMPDMDGIELTRRIKAGESGIKAVVSLVSGDWSMIKEDALEAGVNGYLTKPLFASTIIERINECLDPEYTRRGESYIETAQGSIAGKTLLLAEDVEINREILIALLGETGLIIKEAENGLQAVEMVAADPGVFDLVFMDVQMPIMDGLAATRKIRALPSKHAKTLPIIAMTANVFKEDIDKCLAAGMDGHVGKPLDIEEVLKVIKRHVKHG